MKKLNYLSEEEAKMPLEMALSQIALGLKTCKTIGEAVDLLEDAVELGRREIEEEDTRKRWRDEYGLD